MIENQQPGEPVAWALYEGDAVLHFTAKQSTRRDWEKDVERPRMVPLSIVPLYAHPRPRVVVTDWYVTVDKGGYSYMGHAERNRADVEEEAKLLDDAYPKYAPHRVARVALVSEEDFTEAPADGA